VKPAEDGAFELRNADQRSYVMVDVPDPHEWAVQGVYLDGKDVTEEGVEVLANSTVEGVDVVLAPVATTLAGQIRTPDGKASPSTLVLAFPADESKWADPFDRYVVLTRSDASGHYQIRGLPPGEYNVVVLLPQHDSATVRDPTILSKLRSSASHARVTSQQVCIVDLNR
jgi:hypothetical protein